MNYPMRSLFKLLANTYFSIALLVGCSGYTPQGRVATWDESIAYFEQHKKDFEELRDLLLAEKESSFTVFADGENTPANNGGPVPSKEHLKDYVKRLNKLGLPSASKTFVDPKYPILSFALSATGLVGNGPSVTLWFAKKDPEFPRREMVKIEKTGWYLEARRALKRSDYPE